jgi:hypothetical protein
MPALAGEKVSVMSEGSTRRAQHALPLRSRVQRSIRPLGSRCRVRYPPAHFRLASNPSHAALLRCWGPACGCQKSSHTSYANLPGGPAQSTGVLCPPSLKCWSTSGEEAGIMGFRRRSGSPSSSSWPRRHQSAARSSITVPRRGLRMLSGRLGSDKRWQIAAKHLGESGRRVSRHAWATK